MLDLSNNNGPVRFRRLHDAGQRRVYLKATEGTTFVDRTFRDLRARAQRAGFKTGAYHFGHPEHNVYDELSHFLDHLPRLVHGKDLRPCLDIEWGRPSPAVGVWVVEFCRGIERHLGVKPLVYSYASYLEACRLKRMPGPLWLASYGRNDGREHPFAIPRPWASVAAHQYASTARVAGASGPVDISHVFNFAVLEVPKRR